MMPRDPVKQEATSKGERKYIGNPCKRNHNGIRYTDSGACVECTVNAANARRANRSKA